MHCVVAKKKFKLEMHPDEPKVPEAIYQLQKH